MKVVNRKGIAVDIHFDAIKSRIQRLLDPGDELHFDIDSVTIQTINGIYDGINTYDLDELSSRICASMQSHHYVYDKIASRILVSNNTKQITSHFDIPNKFSSKMNLIQKLSNVLSETFIEYVNSNATVIDNAMRYDRDIRHSFFSLKTLQRSYLIRDHVSNISIESPQDMWMRVAICMHMPDFDRIESCYNDMSSGLYTHATPTLFNSGMKIQQCSSCYLVGTDDSLNGIFKTISDCAQISKWAGGIGIHISNIRCKGSQITSTNGISDGVIPMLKVYNETARYCNQSGRRKGSIAVFLEPWHGDVWEFVELRKNTGAETERARDLFLALWIPDEFMRRVDNDDDWYLMSPDICTDLIDSIGDTFRTNYERHVSNNNYIKCIKARELWQHILQSQLETGTPYIMYKDHVNRKCNQSNMGVIRSSNLCAEITQYSDSLEYGVCNLASISLPEFCDTNIPGSINHRLLHDITKSIVYNLNRVIDINYYPTPESKKSNAMLRPIGIGIQGLGDVYCILSLPYESESSIQLDRDIMETIYHGALTASVELSEVYGPYVHFNGSPASKGVLQFDMWNVTPSDRYDWETLKQRIIKSGLRNSMMTALMPTASTSQILGNCESFEPFHSNIFKRTTIAGEFMVINKHLMKLLLDSNLWNDTIRRSIIKNDGSIQSLDIPSSIKDIYKTVWELPQKSIIDHAVARAPFVDHSQSMNLYMKTPNFQKLSNALFYGWRKGLKTGMYYLRSSAAVEAIKYGVGLDNINPKQTDQKSNNKKICNDDICLLCSS